MRARTPGGSLSVMLPVAFFSAALLITSCSSSSSTTAASTDVHALFVVPSSLDDLADDHFYDHPFPSDLRLDPDGSVHYAGFYNPTLTVIITDYVNETKGLLHGFSPVAASYLRFDGDIDPTTLPADPPSSLSPTSTVQLIDVDPSSPTHGKRQLIQTYWQQAQGIYWMPDTLAVMPALGYPLRPSTKYAIVVTNQAKSLAGTPLLPSADLEEVLELTAPTDHTAAARALFAPAIDEVVSAGIAKTDIAQFTAFTTNDPTSEYFAVADDVPKSVPAPVPATLTQAETTADYDVYESTYAPAPNYQAGNIPYLQPSDGGNFAFDASGKPIVQNTFTMRFTMVVPNVTKCPPPANGYPVVIYAHGTGGDYRSIVTEGNSVGQAVAQRCLASIGTDQIFHGTRPGAPPLNDPNHESDIELIFFNLNNPIAARTNNRQSGIDVVQEARLFTETNLVVPAAVSRTGVDIHFDATRLTFFGHSQGSLNGPLFMAANGATRGGVLSGAAFVIALVLLEKSSPTPSVAQAVRTVLDLETEDRAAELNVFHPALNLAQAIIDATDPVHYARFLTTEPRPGVAPKSIFETEGVNPDGTGDTYAPPHAIEVGAVSLGLPRQAPGIHSITEAPWSGLGDVAIPADGLQGNLANGAASGVIAQFVPAPNDDGHFVVFDVPAARAEAAVFCLNLTNDPKGRVPPSQ